MKPLTIGIIGAGRIGKLHAENLMTRVKGTKLKAVTDPFLDENGLCLKEFLLLEKITGYCLKIQKSTLY